MVSVTVFPQSKMHPAVTAGASVRFLPLGLWTFVSWATAGVQVTPLHPQVLGGAHWVFFFFCLHVLACKDQTRTLYVGSGES